MLTAHERAMWPQRTISSTLRLNFKIEKKSFRNKCGYLLSEKNISLLVWFSVKVTHKPVGPIILISSVCTSSQHRSLQSPERLSALGAKVQPHFNQYQKQIKNAFIYKYSESAG